MGTINVHSEQLGKTEKELVVDDPNKHEEGVKKKEVVYEDKEPRMLGMLLQLTVAKELGLRDEVGMDAYTTHLHEKGMDLEISEEMTKFAHGFARELQDSFPESTYEPSEWFSEVPFLATERQMKEISDFWSQKDEYTTVVRQTGYRDLPELLQALLTQKDFRIPAVLSEGAASNGVNQVAQGFGCDVETLFRIAKGGKGLNDVEFRDLDPQFVRLAEGLSAVASYTYFDFDFDWQKLSIFQEVGELEKHMERYKKMVMSASARIDFFGVAAKKGDSEAQQVASDFSKLLRKSSHDEGEQEKEKKDKTAWHFGNFPLHDLLQYTPEERATARAAIRMLSEGRMSYRMVELKGHFAKLTKKHPWDEAYVQRSFSPEKISQEHYVDVAHSMFAMWEWLRVLSTGDWQSAQQDGESNRRWRQLLSMRPGVSYGGEAREEVRRLAEMYLRAPHEQILGRFYAPWLLRSDKGVFQKRIQVQSQTTILSPPKILHEMVRNGQRMLARVIKEDVEKRRLAQPR